MGRNSGPEAAFFIASRNPRDYSKTLDEPGGQIMNDHQSARAALAPLPGAHRHPAATWIGLTLILLAAALAAPVIQAQNGGVPAELIHYPDFIFHNGQVLTADADRDFTIAEAVAVGHGEIAAWLA